MLIKDVCNECKLTKKAIEYYEKQGLLHPEISENGYRKYNNKDLAVLKEISVLRKLGVSIFEIKSILKSSNKSAALSKCKFLMELKLQKATAQLISIEHLVNYYDIDKEFEIVQDSVDKLFTIKEKLIQAFPGTYGMYLCIHFGKFLNEKIDSKEKEDAYYNIINFLDYIDNFEISTELESYMEKYFSIMKKTDMEDISSNIIHAVDDVQNFIEDNRERLEEYLKIRTSEEWKATPVYKIQQLLLEFQKNSGYYDIFIPNLKILSPLYYAYIRKLEAANEILVEKYPQTKKMYD
jgi:DNA-binding transcriptional MerR regulator